MITNIDIDDAVVAEAMRLSGARTKREVVDRALREMVARASRPSVRELFGIGGVEAAYDPKATWAGALEAGRNRVEEPRATYTAQNKAVKKSASAASAEKAHTAARRAKR
jgi:hypothetical protein